MTVCNRGDVVLISFIFADETGVKRRPAVVISSDAFHSGRDEAIIAAVTSRTDRVLMGDHVINDWQGAGLLFPSVATSIIRTVKQGMIARRLGSMPASDMEIINDKMRMILGLA
jgi:mRNA interferase MazF